MSKGRVCGRSILTPHSTLLTPRINNLPIKAPSDLLHRFLHGLGWQRVSILLFLLRDARGCRFHRLGHIFISFLDDLLDPGLCLDDTLHALPVAVEHKKQVCGQFETLCMPVGIILTWQLIAIPSINNTLYIIPTPF